MTEKISFMSANFVARQLNYNMSEGWAQGDQATNDFFRPPATFAARFEQILLDVRRMGFGAVDIWTAHLHWEWATETQIAQAHDLLNLHRLKVASLAGSFGATRQEFERVCNVARSVGTQTLGGMAPVLFEDRTSVIDLLNEYDLRLSLENHPEKRPEELLEKIGTDTDGRIGAAVDTGWFGTHGYDAAEAIKRLGEHIFHVHLKDVLEPGEHVTCRYGQGCVPIEQCVQALKEIEYAGYYSVEHEPESYDPSEDCQANLQMLREWLAG